MPRYREVLELKERDLMLGGDTMSPSLHDFDLRPEIRRAVQTGELELHWPGPFGPIVIFYENGRIHHTEP